MKDPRKLQEKLVPLLRSSKLHVQIPLDRPWTDLELKSVAWVVEDYVNRNTEVINSDPFKDWVEEYKFFLADFK